MFGKVYLRSDQESVESLEEHLKWQCGNDKKRLNEEGFDSYFIFLEGSPDVDVIYVEDGRTEKLKLKDGIAENMIGDDYIIMPTKDTEHYYIHSQQGIKRIENEFVSGFFGLLAIYGGGKGCGILELSSEKMKYSSQNGAYALATLPDFFSGDDKQGEYYRKLIEQPQFWSSEGVDAVTHILKDTSTLSISYISHGETEIRTVRVKRRPNRGFPHIASIEPGKNGEVGILDAPTVSYAGQIREVLKSWFDKSPFFDDVKYGTAIGSENGGVDVSDLNGIKLLPDSLKYPMSNCI